METKGVSRGLPGWARVALLAGVVVAAVVILVRPWGRSEGNVGTAGTPVVFVLDRSHGKDLKPEDRATLEKLIQEQSGLVVAIQVIEQPVAAIRAFDGHADMGLLDICEYMLAQTRYRVRARLQVTRKDEAVSYTGQILVRTDSPTRALAELGGKKIAYVHPYSTGGFLFPAWLLAENKVTMVAEFAGTHEEALERLRTGKVDAAAVYTGAAKAGEPFRALAVTRTVPNEPVFFREGLDKEKCDRLVAALQELPESGDGKRILALVADTTGFRPTTESDFEPVRAAIQAAGRTVYQVVPEGDSLE